MEVDREFRAWKAGTSISGQDLDKDDKCGAAGLEQLDFFGFSPGERSRIGLAHPGEKRPDQNSRFCRSVLENRPLLPARKVFKWVIQCLDAEQTPQKHRLFSGASFQGTSVDYPLPFRRNVQKTTMIADLFAPFSWL